MSAQSVDQIWHYRAACRGPHSGIFFPPSRLERRPDKRRREQRAKEICAECGVQEECRNYAFSIRELVRRGTVIESDGVYFAKSAVEQAMALLRDALEATPSGLTVAEIRDVFGTTRKFALPLLAYFDGNGITRRREDVRIAGPRMPAA